MSFMSKKSAKHEAASLNGPLGMHAGILIYAVCGVVVLLAARTILLGAWLDTVLLAVGLSATLIFRYLYLSKGNARAVPFLLTTLTVLVSLSLWFNQGLFSGALLAYPVLLVVAGIVVTRALFFSLLLVMLGTVVAVTWAAMTGLHEYQAAPHGIGRLVVVSSLLLMCAAVVWWLIRNLEVTRVHLDDEMLRVQNSQADLTHLSMHDALTDLPNRLLMQERFNEAIALAEEDGTRVALMSFDLDNFKIINDSLGHAAGDELLRRIAERLKGLIRGSDTVSRQGGDEFLVLLGDVDTTETLELVARRFQELVARPLVLHDIELVTSLSIGISVYPDDGTDFGTLLKKAELAMYQAKAAGRNAYCLFSEEMNTNTYERLGIEQDLRQALVREEFKLQYQPIVDLHSGLPVAVEALIRWHQPERGLVGPTLFVGVAEQMGLIVEIGEWVLQEACEQAMRWREAGLPDLIMSVNLSAVQLRRGNLEAVVKAALKDSGLPPHCLELELTESMLLQDSDASLILLQNLKALGVKLSIDDFGTGYSNLSYLQRFQVDTLKIDKSFVQNLGENTQHHAIVNAIIQMAHSLNLRTIAEGIEDQSTRQMLAELGCDLGQGYLFAKPLAPEDFAALAAG
ncbi:MAG: EAL domain-containing protein [Pseudomonas sp.]|nr:EAL domain-containing protein [Pseudomonas sp.]